MKGIRFPRRKGPTESVRSIRRTDQPDPKFNYELFNRNKFNIRYWSWNYRGCWPFFAIITEGIEVRDFLKLCLRCAFSLDEVGCQMKCWSIIYKGPVADVHKLA
jgi:hypothetical protein